MRKKGAFVLKGASICPRGIGAADGDKSFPILRRRNAACHAGEKVMNYQINDTILYGSQGVCKITGTVQKDFGGCVMDYYTLQPVYSEKCGGCCLRRRFTL